MSSQKQALFEEIDLKIKSNGSGEITAPILNNVLKQLAEAGSTKDIYRYPKATVVTANDLGKVMMLDGEKKAAVYAYAPAQEQVSRKGIFTFSGLASAIQTPPSIGEHYYKKTISLSSANIGDFFKLYLGKELFQATVASAQDLVAYEIGYDTDMSVFRANTIALLNNYGAVDIQAEPHPTDTDKINIMVPSPDGRLMVFWGYDSLGFKMFNGAFEEVVFTPSYYSSEFVVQVGDEITKVPSVVWRNGEIPSDLTDELTLLTNYINSNFDNLTAALTENEGELVLEEIDYKDTLLSFEGWQNEVEIIAFGHGPIVASPAAYPLGKLVGIEGDTALISAALIETYNLDSPMEELNLDYLNAGYPDNNNILGWIYYFLKHILVPADGGGVVAFNLEDIADDDGIHIDRINHNVLGFVVHATNSQVSVINTAHLNYLLRIFLKFSKGTAL